MRARRWITVLLVFGLLAAAVGGAAWMVRTAPQPKAQTPGVVVPMLVAPPIRPQVGRRAQIVGYGSARPRTRVEISPLVGGKVLWRADYFLAGRFVAEGQPLLRIDPNDFELALRSAVQDRSLHEAQLLRVRTDANNLDRSLATERRRLELAQSQYDKTKALYDRGVTGVDDVETAEDRLLAQERSVQAIQDSLAVIPARVAELKALLDGDEVRIDRARLDLARTVVRSDISGRVLDRSVEVGERVQAGQVCGEVYGTKVMEVPVSVPAEDLRWLDPAVLARSGTGPEPCPEEVHDANVSWLASANGRTVCWDGCVGRVEAGLEAQTRTAVVVVLVRNPPPGSGAWMLELNMFCRVRIEGMQFPEAFVLPRKALLAGEKVYVVRDGRLTTRRVHPTRVLNEEVVILPGGGLTAGDRVVLSYVPKPVEGMRVEAVDANQ